MVGICFTTPWQLVFPIPRGCCLALSASSAIPCPVTPCHIPSQAQSPRPVVSRSQGAVVWPVLHPCPSPVPPSHPSFRVYTPRGCQQPSGAGPQDPHPSRDCSVLLARVAPIQSPSSTHSARSPLLVPIRGVWPLFPSHGPICLLVYWHENTACRGGCPAGTPLRVPPLGLGGEVCSVFCMLGPHVVLLSLTLSCRPRMAGCPSDVCPSPLKAQSFFLLFPPYLAQACCCVCDLRPGSCLVGSPCDPPVYGHKNTACCFFLFVLRLWPSRDATTRTPARAWTDGVLCCCAPPASRCPC